MNQRSLLISPIRVRALNVYIVVLFQLFLLWSRFLHCGNVLAIKKEWLSVVKDISISDPWNEINVSKMNNTLKGKLGINFFVMGHEHSIRKYINCCFFCFAFSECRLHNKSVLFNL